MFRLIFGMTIAAATLVAPANAEHLSWHFESIERLPFHATQHRDVLLSDGRVLITGGRGVSDGLSDAAVFDPAVRRFQRVGSMETGRFVHGVVSLPDGNAIVFGGFKQGLSFLDSSELFDAKTNVFVKGPRLTEPRDNERYVTLSDGSIFITGGDNDRLGMIETTEFYKPDRQVFEKGPSMPRDRAMDSVVRLQDGRIFIAGGISIRKDEKLFTPRQTLLFDPATQTFQKGPLLHQGRKQHRATLLEDGRVLITGGNDGLHDLRSVEIFDPRTGAMTKARSLARQRSEHCSILLKDGTVAIIGGADGLLPESGRPAEYLKTTEIFDPQTNRFHPGPDLHQGRAWQQCTSLKDGSVLVTGGYDDAALDSAELMIGRDKVLEIGSRGPAVRDLQLALNGKGAVPSLHIDGVYGIATKNAVVAYQQLEGLDPTGIADTTTTAAISSKASAAAVIRSWHGFPWQPGKLGQLLAGYCRYFDWSVALSRFVAIRSRCEIAIVHAFTMHRV